MKLINKKGDLSTVLASIIIVSILAFTFFNYMFIDVDSMKYETIQQYAKDMLLYLETNSAIEKTYLVNTKNKLETKLNNSGGISTYVYITVNNVKYNVNSMPRELVPDFGTQLELEISHNYKPKRIEFLDSLIGQTDNTSTKTMGVDLTTISKNRGTTDG